MRKRLIGVLKRHRKSDLELLDEFCKRRGYDMRDSARKYEARLQEFDKEVQS